MAMQLTFDQEERIRAVVQAGAYSSVEDALNAAVAAVESIAAPGFEGTEEELNALLTEGLQSGEPVVADDAFWSSLTERTDHMVEEHRARRPHRDH